MANPYYLPQGYQPFGYQAQAFNQQPQTIQSGGLVSVRSRAEAQNYPVAPGNSVTFKDETAPFIYTKTMGFSQLDRPIFEIFRLMKEEDEKPVENAQNTVVPESNIDLTLYAKKADLDALSARISAIEEKYKPKKEKKSDE